MRLKKIASIDEYRESSDIIKLLLSFLPFLLCMIILLFPEHAFAQRDDTLREHATAIENFLTGNIMRGVAVGGNIWGLVQSYMKSSVMVLSGVVGIDLIGWGMLAWVRSTWALVI